MGDKYNIFISWSGQRSRWAAQALREWLPVVLQCTKPWMSDHDIEKGSRWLDELGKAIDGIKIGIICLTPENLNVPWILFESGALSKTLDPRTHVCTYLLGGLQPQDVKQPLGMFQHSRATKDDTRKLLHSINLALAEQIPEANLDLLFDSMWPQMSTKLATMPEPDQVVETKRSVDEMVAEILEFERAADKRRRESLVEEYEPVLKDLFPILRQFLAEFKRQQAHQVAVSADPMIQTDSANAVLKNPNG